MTFPTNPLDINRVYGTDTYTLVTGPSDSDPNHTQNWFIIGDGIGYAEQNNLFIGNSYEVASRGYAVVSFCAFGQDSVESPSNLGAYLPTGLVSLDMMPYIMIRAAQYYHEWYQRYYDTRNETTYPNGVTSL